LSGMQARGEMVPALSRTDRRPDSMGQLGWHAVRLRWQRHSPPGVVLTRLCHPCARISHRNFNARPRDSSRCQRDGRGVSERCQMLEKPCSVLAVALSWLYIPVCPPARASHPQCPRWVPGPWQFAINESREARGNLSGRAPKLIKIMRQPIPLLTTRCNLLHALS
jgi:hypothetical protein